MQLTVLTSESSGSGGSCGCGSGGQAPVRRGVTRRSFLRSAAAVTGGLAAFGAAISPLRKLADIEHDTFANFFQRHYKEMSEEDIDQACRRIEQRVSERYGFEVADRSSDEPQIDDGGFKKVNCSDPKPMDGVEFVYALNLSRCNGNRRCVHACVKENNQSRNPEMQYIRVLEMPRGTIDLDDANHHYDHETVPDKDHYYLPVQCHQCADPPCTKVCPVEATWQEADGITVVDYDWCIGCRYCEAACPYWARRFNFAEPSYATEEELAEDPDIIKKRLNPDISYLSNRPRPKGVMEKCTYCLHRTRVGRMPACLEACPVGARKFGNVLDPNSEVSQILRNKRVFVLKEEVGTLPRFFYYFDERRPRSESNDETIPPPLGPRTAPAPENGEVSGGDA